MIEQKNINYIDAYKYCVNYIYKGFNPNKIGCQIAETTGEATNSNGLIVLDVFSTRYFDMTVVTAFLVCNCPNLIPEKRYNLNNSVTNQ